jgi:hypothetical protein
MEDGEASQDVRKDMETSDGAGNKGMKFFKNNVKNNVTRGFDRWLRQ